MSVVFVFLFRASICAQVISAILVISHKYKFTLFWFNVITLVISTSIVSTKMLQAPMLEEDIHDMKLRYELLGNLPSNSIRKPGQSSWPWANMNA